MKTYLSKNHKELNITTTHRFFSSHFCYQLQKYLDYNSLQCRCFREIYNLVYLYIFKDFIHNSHECPTGKHLHNVKKSFVKFVYFLHADFKYNIVDYFQILYIGNGFYTVYNIIFLILVELSVFGSILFRYAKTTKGIRVSL